MRGVRIDWAEAFHLVALGRPGDGVLDIARVEHDPRSIDALIAGIAVLEPDPVDVRVALETSYGCSARSGSTSATRSCRSTPTWLHGFGGRRRRRTISADEPYRTLTS